MSIRKFKENCTRNSWYAKNFLVFCILGFLCIHACAVNVSLELIENFYFSPWKRLEFAYHNPARTLRYALEDSCRSLYEHFRRILPLQFALFNSSLKLLWTHYHLNLEHSGQQKFDLWLGIYVQKKTRVYSESFVFNSIFSLKILLTFQVNSRPAACLISFLQQGKSYNFFFDFFCEFLILACQMVKFYR